MDYESESEEEEQETYDQVSRPVTQQKKSTGIFSLFKYIPLFTKTDSFFKPW